MKISKLLIVFILMHSIELRADYFPDTKLINAMLNQEICTLYLTRVRSSDIKTIQNIQRSIEDTWADEFSSIYSSLEDNNLSCYVKINSTAIYAQIISSKNDYKNAELLFLKTLKYKGLDSNFKKSMYLKIKQLQAITSSKKQQSGIHLNSNSSKKYPEKKENDKNVSLELLARNLVESLRADTLKDELLIKAESQINSLEMRLDELKIQLNEIDLAYIDEIKNLKSNSIKIKKNNANLQRELESSNRALDEILSEREDSVLFSSNLLLLAIIFILIITIINNSKNFNLKTLPTKKKLQSIQPKLYENNFFFEVIKKQIGQATVPLIKGEYLYGYFIGVSENIISDNELESSYLLDRLIDICFSESSLIIKNHFRFSDSDEIKAGREDGEEDTLFFYKNEGLINLSKHTESDLWNEILNLNR